MRDAFGASTGVEFFGEMRINFCHKHVIASGKATSHLPGQNSPVKYFCTFLKRNPNLYWKLIIILSASFHLFLIKYSTHKVKLDFQNRATICLRLYAAG